MPMVFKPILPGKFNDRVFQEEFKAAAKPYADGIARDYEATYSTWSQESQPEQRVEIVANPNGGIAIYIDIIGQIYEWLHDGTEGPYTIAARRAKVLSFQSGYNAKTAPGRIRAANGGAFGERVYRRVVTHPGIEARNFTRPILAKWKPAFYKAIDRAVSRAVQRSGHKL